LARADDPATTRRRTFPLAEMSPLVLVLTVIVLTLPVALAVVGLGAPRPGRSVLLAVAGMLAVLWIVVWLYFRPSRFELTSAHLSIVWPARRRDVPRVDIVRARLVSRREFRQEFGWAARIGVGGLWGAFGLLWTAQGGMMDLYVSRVDQFVLVERRSARPILITPARPEEFLRALSVG